MSVADTISRSAETTNKSRMSSCINNTKIGGVTRLCEDQETFSRETSVGLYFADKSEITNTSCNCGKCPVLSDYERTRKGIFRLPGNPNIMIVADIPSIKEQEEMTSQMNEIAF